MCNNSGADYVGEARQLRTALPRQRARDRARRATLGEEPADERPRGPEVIGELWIKGPNVIRGYWNKPEATAESFTSGWLRTGDIARIDDEGFVFIVDRAKDMIIRGGENVYSVIVEAAIFEHPDVADCAVVGLAAPHPRRRGRRGHRAAPRTRRRRRRDQPPRRAASREVRSTHDDRLSLHAPAAKPSGQGP